MSGAAPENGGKGAGRDEVKQICTVLYAVLPPLDSSALQSRLETLVGSCRVEWAVSSGHNLPFTAGVVQFGPHRIAMIALNARVKEDVLLRTVGVSPMPEELRQVLMAHGAIIRLLYVGDEPEPTEQLTAVYQVAGALLRDGGWGILNERAALAQPAELAQAYLSQLGHEPLPLPLWVGVVTYLDEEKSQAQRYLMRTYGMEQFALPELSAYFGDKLAADDTYHLLLNVGLYLIESTPRTQMAAGHTAEYQGRTYLFTEPTDTGPELSSPTGLLVLIEV